MKHLKGFNLIEPMIVVAIIAILIALLWPHPPRNAIQQIEVAAAKSPESCYVVTEYFVTSSEVAEFLNKHGEFELAGVPTEGRPVFKRKNCDK